MANFSKQGNSGTQSTPHWPKSASNRQIPIFGVSCASCFVLPATWSEPEPVARESAPSPSTLAGLTICAIDNEPRILDGMRTLLEGWGCTVVTAATRTEAIAALASKALRPDAVVVDYHLDGDNGVDVIAALRAHFDAELPAVLVTADRTEELRTEAAARDIRVLAKPLKPAALRALLAQWRVTRSAAE